MENGSDHNSSNKKSRGQWTAKVAEILRSEFPDFDVFYDHGDSSRRIVCYVGDNNERGTQLSYLDIAVVKKNTNQAIALIEIEETANRPKTIIADIFAFLLGETVIYNRTKLQISNKTTFIVLGFSNKRVSVHTQHIRERVSQAKSAIDTKNAEVWEVVVEVYSSKEQLF